MERLKNYIIIFVFIVLWSSHLNAAETSSEYEVFFSPVSWGEAKRSCEERGGYLLCLDDREEYTRVVQFLEEQGLRGCRFYIGASRFTGGRDYYWVNRKNQYTANAEYLKDAWLEGEPSYSDSTLYVDETVAELLYLDSYQTWLLNDVPYDLPRFVEDTSKIGYICEYEDFGVVSGTSASAFQAKRMSGRISAMEGFPEDFTFASGVGGWSTQLMLNQDWSFYGEYSNTDSGVDPVCYIRDFEGQFSQPEQVSDYIYSMHLLSLDYLGGETGSSYYTDNLRYEYSGAYGLDGGDEFLIVMPGAPLTELPEGFISWSYPWFNPEKYSVVPSGVYGIYNVSEEDAFFGGNSEQNYQPEEGVFLSDYHEHRAKLTISSGSEARLEFLTTSEDTWSWRTVDFGFSYEGQTDFEGYEQSTRTRYHIELDGKPADNTLIMQVYSYAGDDLTDWGPAENKSCPITLILTREGTVQEKFYPKDTYIDYRNIVKNGVGIAWDVIDGDGKVLWSYSSYIKPGAQLSPFRQVGKTKDRLYFSQDGILIAFDLYTGEILWKNYDAGFCEASAFDSNGNLFLCGGPREICMVNPDGEAQRIQIPEEKGSGYEWPYMMAVEDDGEVVITFEFYPDVDNQLSFNYKELLGENPEETVKTTREYPISKIKDMTNLIHAAVYTCEKKEGDYFIPFVRDESVWNTIAHYVSFEAKMDPGIRKTIENGETYYWLEESRVKRILEGLCEDYTGIMPALSGKDVIMKDFIYGFREQSIGEETICTECYRDADDGSKEVLVSIDSTGTTEYNSYYLVHLKPIDIPDEEWKKSGRCGYIVSSIEYITSDSSDYEVTERLGGGFQYI